MVADDLCFLPIAQLADQIKKKAVSPVEVTQAYLARIPEVDPALNSYLTVTAEQAMHDAWQAESEIQANRYRGPLYGISLALQIVGKAFDEATVLQIGHAHEMHTRWHKQRPPVDA